jgi:hypothetical protein
MTGPDANLTKKYRGLLRVYNNRERHMRFAIMCKFLD